MLEINKIYNENCLLTLAKMPENFIDLIITSPPYDDLREYNNLIWNFDIFKKIANELFRIVKIGGITVWIVGDATIKGSETGSSFKQVLYFKEIGFNLHDTMIYEKSGIPFPSKNRYYAIFEYMFILSKGKPKTVNLIKDKKNLCANRMAHWGKANYRQKDGSLKSTDHNYIIPEFSIRTNIWRILTGKGNITRDEIAYKHPAQFPEKLVFDHIISWSNKEDLVYDPFMGSGTTAKIAKLLNRNYIGSEISSEYCSIAEERLKNY